MSDEEKIKVLRPMVEDEQVHYSDDVLSAYLYQAGQKLLRWVYPFDKSVKDVPDEYAYKQIEIAAYLINKRGAEGEVAHNENGINRTYENGDVPASMLREITPHCGVLK